VFGYRIPGFVAAQNASSAEPPVLVVLAEARKYTNSDEGAHNLVAKRSTSGGASWGPSQTVVEPPKLWGKQEGGIKGGAVYDPTPVFDAVTGAIRVIFSYCPARYMSRPPISQAFELWEVTVEDPGSGRARVVHPHRRWRWERHPDSPWCQEGPANCARLPQLLPAAATATATTACTGAWLHPREGPGTGGQLVQSRRQLVQRGAWASCSPSR
jgi:hypothetical protein